MSSALFRPMSTGEILDVAFGLYRRHLATLVTLSVLLTGLPLLIFTAVSGYLVVTSPENVFLLLLVFMGLMVGYVVLAQLALGASMVVVSQGYLGRSMSAGPAIRETMSRLGTLIAAGLLVGLVSGLGMFLLIVPGVILFCGLSLTTPVVMLESPGGAFTAMGRSWNLTQGYRWRMFLLILVGVVLSIVVIMGVNIILGLAFGGLTSFQPGVTPRYGVLLAQQGVQLLANMLIAPLPHCILTVAYYDLRIRKEAFDLEMLASTLQPA